MPTTDMFSTALDRVVSTLQSHVAVPRHELPTRARVESDTCQAILEALMAYNVVKLDGPMVRYQGLGLRRDRIR